MGRCLIEHARLRFAAEGHGRRVRGFPPTGEQFADPAAEDRGFQQGIRGQAVGPVHAGAGTFPGGPQSGNSGAAQRIGGDATHEVVRGGAHGDPLGGPVDASPRELGVNGREPAGQELGAGQPGRNGNRGAVQVCGAVVGCRARREDRARHHVPGSEFRAGVHIGHEAVTVLIAQYRSLTADRLGDQERSRCRQCGGVELEELQVTHLCAGAQGQRDAVPGGHRGIGRPRIQLTGAARGEHHVVRGQELFAAQLSAVENRADGAAHDPVTDHDDVRDHGVFAQTDMSPVGHLA